MMRLSVPQRFRLFRNLILSGIVGGLAAFAQKPSLEWARTPGPASHEGNGIATDNGGNIYVTGQMQATLFQDGKLYADIAGTNLAVGQRTDYFLLKYNPAGEPLWIRHAGGNEFDYGTAVRVAANNDVVTTLGLTTNLFHGETLPHAGKRDIVVARYNPAGDLLWARSAGGAGDDLVSGFDFDSSGNIYIVGRVDGVATFGATEIGERFQSMSYLAKYSPAGELAWVKQLGRTGGDMAIDIDAADQLYLSGNSSGNFGGETGRGVVVAKYDASGNKQWVKIFPAASADGGTTIAAVPDHGLYVAGTHTEPLTLGSVTLQTSNRALRGFVAKFDFNGNPVWAHPSGGRAYSVDVTADGTAYAGGFFSTNAPNIGGSTPANVRVNDAYLMVVNSAGTVTSVTAFGSSYSDIFRDIHLGTDGKLYAVGEANGPAFRLDEWQGSAVVSRFSLAPAAPQGPALAVQFQGNALLFSYPATEIGFTLQATSSLGEQFAPAAAIALSGEPDKIRIQVPLGTEKARFFRLVKNP